MLEVNKTRIKIEKLQFQTYPVKAHLGYLREYFDFKKFSLEK